MLTYRQPSRPTVWAIGSIYGLWHRCLILSYTVYSGFGQCSHHVLGTYSCFQIRHWSITPLQNKVHFKSQIKTNSAYFCLPSCNIAHNMEVLADFRCCTLLSGFGPVSIQLEWPPDGSAVWPLVRQNRDHQEDHLVCQLFWDSWWVHSYFEPQLYIHILFNYSCQKHKLHLFFLFECY